MKGVILDGVWGSDTDLLYQSLQQKIHQRYPTSSKIFLNENYCDSVFNQIDSHRILKGEDFLSYRKVVLQQLIYHQNLIKNFENIENSQEKSFVIIKNFVFSLLLNFSQAFEQVPNYEIKRLIDKIIDLEFVCIVLPASFFKLQRFVYSYKDLNILKQKLGLDSKVNPEFISKYLFASQQRILKALKLFEAQMNMKFLHILDMDTEEGSKFVFKSFLS